MLTKKIRNAILRREENKLLKFYTQIVSRKKEIIVISSNSKFNLFV